MEKYNYLNNEQVENTQSRVSKNIALYDEVKECELSRVNNNSNVKIIDENGQAEPVGKEVKPEDKKSFLDTIESCPTEAISIVQE